MRRAIPNTDNPAPLSGTSMISLVCASIFFAHRSRSPRWSIVVTLEYYEVQDLSVGP